MFFEPPRNLLGGSFHEGLQSALLMIDSHAHLTDERYASDVDQVVARAAAAGVETIVSIATDPDDARAAIALAERHPRMFATVGVHPHAAGKVPPEALEEIRALAEHPRVVAIGEAGLDYHYDFAPREAQLEWFRRQLALGAELDLPVVVHAREADDDVAALLREAGSATRGVLHCFSSGRPLLEEALSLGWYVSFGGMVTFKRFDAEDLVRLVPEDRLLVETDSPYLAPVPHRGRRNEPAHIPIIIERLASIRGATSEAMATATTRNAAALYRLPG